MSVSFRLTVERIMFYAMVVIMVAARFVPSAQCAGLACVLVALALLYAVGSWWGLFPAVPYGGVRCAGAVSGGYAPRGVGRCGATPDGDGACHVRCHVDCGSMGAAEGG